VAEYKILVKAYVAAKIAAIEPKSELVNLQRRMAGMIDDPQPCGAKTLPGYTDRFRLRVGSHVLVYQVDAVRRHLTVVAVRARRRFQAQMYSAKFYDIDTTTDAMFDDIG